MRTRRFKPKKRTSRKYKGGTTPSPSQGNNSNGSQYSEIEGIVPFLNPFNVDKKEISARVVDCLWKITLPNGEIQQWNTASLTDTLKAIDNLIKVDGESLLLPPSFTGRSIPLNLKTLFNQRLQRYISTDMGLAVIYSLGLRKGASDNLRDIMHVLGINIAIQEIENELRLGTNHRDQSSQGFSKINGSGHMKYATPRKRFETVPTGRLDRFLYRNTPIDSTVIVKKATDDEGQRIGTGNSIGTLKYQYGKSISISSMTTMAVRVISSIITVTISSLKNLLEKKRINVEHLETVTRAVSFLESIIKEHRITLQETLVLFRDCELRAYSYHDPTDEITHIRIGTRNRTVTLTKEVSEDYFRKLVLRSSGIYVSKLIGRKMVVSFSIPDYYGITLPSNLYRQSFAMVSVLCRFINPFDTFVPAILWTMIHGHDNTSSFDEDTKTALERGLLKYREKGGKWKPLDVLGAQPHSVLSYDPHEDRVTMVETTNLFPLSGPIVDHSVTRHLIQNEETSESIAVPFAYASCTPCLEKFWAHSTHSIVAFDSVFSINVAGGIWETQDDSLFLEMKCVEITIVDEFKILLKELGITNATHIRSVSEYCQMFDATHPELFHFMKTEFPQIGILQEAVSQKTNTSMEEVIEFLYKNTDINSARQMLQYRPFLIGVRSLNQSVTIGLGIKKIKDLTSQAVIGITINAAKLKSEFEESRARDLAREAKASARRQRAELTEQADDAQRVSDIANEVMDKMIELNGDNVNAESVEQENGLGAEVARESFSSEEDIIERIHRFEDENKMERDSLLLLSLEDPLTDFEIEQESIEKALDITIDDYNSFFSVESTQVNESLLRKSLSVGEIESESFKAQDVGQEEPSQQDLRDETLTEMNLDRFLNNMPEDRFKKKFEPPEVQPPPPSEKASSRAEEASSRAKASRLDPIMSFKNRIESARLLMTLYPGADEVIKPRLLDSMKESIQELIVLWEETDELSKETDVYIDIKAQIDRLQKEYIQLG